MNWSWSDCTTCSQTLFAQVLLFTQLCSWAPLPEGPQDMACSSGTSLADAVYGAGMRKRSSCFSQFMSRQCLFWKGMTTNQPLLYFNSILQHSMFLLFFFFFFSINFFKPPGSLTQLFSFTASRACSGDSSGQNSAWLPRAVTLTSGVSFSFLSTSQEGTRLKGQTSGDPETIQRWSWND